MAIYFDQFKIPLLNWHNAGLTKPSRGLGYRLIKLTEQELKSVIKNEDYIGKLDKDDLEFLINKIEQIHND